MQTQNKKQNKVLSLLKNRGIIRPRDLDEFNIPRAVPGALHKKNAP